MKVAVSSVLEISQTVIELENIFSAASNFSSLETLPTNFLPAEPEKEITFFNVATSTR